MRKAVFLFYCDESNLEPYPNDFFVYGGIAIPADRAIELSNRVEDIRCNAGIAPDFCLKFNPRPPHLDHGQFIEVKREVIQAAANSGCELLTSFISHNIANNPNEARRNEINRVCYNFDCLLAQLESSGIVLFDRFSDQQIDSHLREKFSIGLTGMPYSDRMRLERIMGFHYSAIGQSHFPSVVDIILGSLRFCINTHTRGLDHQIPSTARMLDLLSPLYRRREDGRVPEIALFFSPKIVKAQAYREQYESLKQFLSEHGIVASQPITNERTY